MKNGKIIDRKDIRKSVYIRWTIRRGWGPIPCASFDRHYLLRSWKMAKSRCPAPGKWKTDPSYDFSASRVGYIPFRLHCRVTIFPEEGGGGVNRKAQKHLEFAFLRYQTCSEFGGNCGRISLSLPGNSLSISKSCIRFLRKFLSPLFLSQLLESIKLNYETA